MDATKIIEAMGGRRRVMQITGLTKGRISQWVSGNHIPDPWMVAFRAMNPDALRQLDESMQESQQP
ncbi:hypothetical protein [Caballeronia glathei]|uniref:Cro/Cl family transcriptional regulator n=1 Tax=Caballeronia glathei TaxID=60547 RepID=A0A069PMP8_9BURK|nr:hypothetical protein [Caballeronia glathei]KDR41149.1 hypothetical protein BG61_20790 [Caballeronia glathei]